MRNPLEKQTFMGGNRQRWFAILLLMSVLVLICDMQGDVDAVAYLNFLTITGSVFIIGSSADSALKIKATKKQQLEESQNNHEEHC